ncbi:pentapeptide repeat-containing protein [Sulfurimonas sp.]|uniref:pentapeptide repeat-containing protein n=1 Tax=Sulfurimonas sp. TaxID=2022749 RepID=UPI00356AB75B
MAVVSIVDGLDCFAEDFKGITLHGSKIKRAEFEACTFVSCDFSETFFLSCRFIECRFENCNLSLVKLTGTKMSDVTFVSCKMVGIDWTMCDYKSLLSAEPLRFVESILNDSNFYGLELEDLVMKECRAKEVDFREASLKRADFSGTDFKGALFENTNLEYANFRDAQNTYIDIRRNHLKKATFDRYEALFLLEIMEITLV